MNTLEFYIEVQNTSPIYLCNQLRPPPPNLKLSYWALSADAYGVFPPVLMHIYCHGPLPDDDRRDQINAAIKDFVGRMLTKP